MLGAGLVMGMPTTLALAASPSSAPAPSDPLPSDGVPFQSPPATRVLLAYFSRAGENYHYGDTVDLAVGNTQVVADMIASLAPVDVYRIEAADPYPHDYDATVARNVQEQDADARPAIAGELPDMSAYDTLLLGSPIWNVRPPMIMRTFLAGVDIAGKALFPFVTYAVSGLGRTVQDYADLAPDSPIGEALAVQGEEVAGAEPEVETWLRRIGLI